MKLHMNMTDSSIRSMKIRIEEVESLTEFLNMFGIDYSEDIKEIKFGNTINDFKVIMKNLKRTKKGNSVKHKKSYHDAMSHWRNMPEFVQKKQTTLSTIIISMDESLTKEFGDMIGTNITPKTKSLRYPFRPHRRESNYVYV